MTDIKDSKNNGKRLDAVIGAFTGVVIGEIGRQMVQVDQVPWWRVLLLIVSSLVGGGIVTISFYKYPWNTKAQSSSSND